LGGCVRYVVLDNLKAGVLRPDLYEPELNPLYAALLRHYGAVADPCRVRDPNRKGSVENAIQHTQSTALKGRRFESIEAQNAWLAHWEERWAAPRLHGRKKRQVLAMFQEEQPHLLPLPAERFRYFTQGTRTVDDAGLVQVDGSYYAALPAPPHSAVMVRIYDREIEILDAAGQHVRRHEKSLRKGSFTLELATLKFLDAKEDVLVIGPPGTGKSHIAKALATTAVRRGYKVLYREAHQLIEDITEARELGDLRKLRAQIRGAELLLIDDLFLRKLPAQAGDELADVLMGRYEKASTILTSNRPLDDWTRLLGDVVVVTPLLDRLMHHGHLLKFEGKSWRLKEAAARAAKRG
jgi:DNA replication protein DnaC